MQRCLLVLILVILGPGFAFCARDYISDTSIPDNEDGAYPVTNEYRIDLDGDKTKELVRVNYGPGVSDKALTIEIFKGNKKIDTLKNRFGIQANYKIEDIDKDGKKEIVIWEGLWDPRIPGEDGVTEKTYEGHSDKHHYLVMTYKLIRGKYYLWEAYTTKKKYEPFCEKQPQD